MINKYNILGCLDIESHLTTKIQKGKIVLLQKGNKKIGISEKEAAPDRPLGLARDSPKILTTKERAEEVARSDQIDIRAGRLREGETTAKIMRGSIDLEITIKKEN